MIINVALDTTTLNVTESAIPLKKLFDKVFPTRNIVNKYNHLRKINDENIRVGLFCNGTHGLNVPKIVKKYSINIMGVYLAKKFMPEDQDNFMKLIIKGLVFEKANDLRLWNILRREKKYKINQLKILRIDNPWLYFSLYEKLNQVFTIAIDFDSNESNQYSYLEKMRKLVKYQNKVVASCLTTNIDLNYLDEMCSSFFDAIEMDKYQSITCPVLVMSYLNRDKKLRMLLLKRFARHCYNKNIINPLVIVKFAKDEYFSAEIFFDDFLREVNDIFTQNK